MSLIIGESLKPERFFSSGEPIARGSSFDLTVGTIFDHEGKKIDGTFRLEPGHMVQVVSAEVFRLPDTITGHVTYKTSLTRKGVWALTVGIVDPGWTGPIATTLLNFSRTDYAISAGDPFLRVSFFAHDPVPAKMLPKSTEVPAYMLDVQKIAMTRFPQTFLNQEEIAKQAGDKVLQRIRSEGLAWVTAIAAIFTIIQLVLNVSNRPAPSVDAHKAEPQAQQVEQLQSQIRSMGERIRKMEVRDEQTPPVQTQAGGAKQNSPDIKSSNGMAVQH